jgi:transposase
VLYSGIDLHKRTVVITTVDEQGAVVAEKSLPTSRSAVARYFQWLREPTVATVEATSSWYWLRDLLDAEDVPLTLAHAKFVKAIAYAKVKTDAVDALTLAQLHRADLIPRAHMVSHELRPLRDLLRTRLHLVEKRTSAKNSVQRLLEKFNVPGPEQLPDEATLQAELYQQQIDLLTEQVLRIEQQLQPRLIPNPDVQRLLWIPGVGKLVAFALYLEIDGIERFDTVRRFFSYCRVVPGADNSGPKRRHGRRKDGNRYLKLALSHAAVRAVQYYPEIKRFYQRKARQKNPAIARTLVQKEIARAVYVVLKENVEFNHTFKGQPLSKRKASQWPRRASPDA